MRENHRDMLVIYDLVFVDRFGFWTAILVRLSVSGGVVDVSENGGIVRVVGCCRRISHWGTLPFRFAP